MEASSGEWQPQNRHAQAQKEKHCWFISRHILTLIFERDIAWSPNVQLACSVHTATNAMVAKRHHVYTLHRHTISCHV